MSAALAAAVALAFTPNPSHFGELVTVKVSGTGAPPSFKPFVVRSQHGSTYVLQCLDPACLPGPKPRTLTVAGRRVVIVPRVSAAEASKPLRSFHRQSTPPPLSYRIRPGLLRALLLAGAALFVALAAAAAWPLLRRAVPDVRDRRTPLERALDLARASLQRNAADRRRALDLLGRTLGAKGDAQAASELAWSRPEPDPARIEGLLERVEHES